MELVILTGSVSRLGGGLFDAVRKPAAILHGYQGTSVQILSLQDEFTLKDVNDWLPVVPKVFPHLGPDNFGYSPALRYHLEESRPDILHAHGIWMYQSFVTMKYCAKHNVPYLVSPHGMLDPWALKNSGWKKWIAGILYEDRNLHRACCLHALNQSEVQAMKSYGLKKPICRIPNGIDLACSKSFEPPWKYVVEPGKKILLFLGRIHPKKGLPSLIKAWRYLLDSRPSSSCDWSLVIVGWDQGGHELELKKMCQDLSLVDSVHFMGPLHADNKIAAYQNADAFILPSWSEGLPMTVLEAWANKLPVLMTPQCNLPEGFLSNAAIEIQTTFQTIKRGLSQLLEMSGRELEEMGLNGYCLVEKEYNWEKIAADLFSVYKWVLGGGSVPSCVMMN